MYIFSMDNPFFRFVGKAVDIVWINILTVICCLPVVTAGAAFTSMYKTLLRITMGEESAITVPFFREFKNSLKQTMKVWIPCLLIGAILIYNALLLYDGGFEVFGNMMYGAGISIGILLIVLILFCHYYFCIMARYENDNRQNIKNAFLLMVAFFPSSVSMLILTVLPFALMTISDVFFWLYFMYGFALPGLLIAMLMGRNFRKIENKQSEDQETLVEASEESTTED